MRTARFRPRPHLCNSFSFCCSHCASLSRCACIFCKPVVFERRSCRVPPCHLARARLPFCTIERAQTRPIDPLDACCVQCGPGMRRGAAAMARSMGATDAQLTRRTPRLKRTTNFIETDPLAPFFESLPFFPTDCILRFTQDQNRYGATRAAFVPVCILFVEASVLTPQLVRCGRLKKCRSGVTRLPRIVVRRAMESRARMRQVRCSLHARAPLRQQVRAACDGHAVSVVAC
jgi:hypothetical protein